MSLKLSFTWIGLVVFALPMLINIAYVLFPPAGKPEQPAAAPHWLELVEQVSRIAYLLAVTLLVSREQLRLQSAWLYLAALFLILYDTVWLRYFMGGREIALLAVFPVLYFLCAAIWLHNLPAAIIMLVFGAAHLTVSIQSFR